jgi:hypothetical protein
VPVTLTDPAFGDLLQEQLAQHPRRTYTLDAIFGVDPSHDHDALAAESVRAVACACDACGLRQAQEPWQVARARARVLGDLSADERALLVSELESYVARTSPRTPTIGACLRSRSSTTKTPRNPPSNALALRRFRDIGVSLGMRIAFLNKREIHRLGEFSALFIRDTTNVDHYTYDFARRRRRSGLVVIDDPDSIHEVHQQGVPARAARAPSNPYAAHGGGSPPESRIGDGCAGLAVRAQAA